MLKFNYNAIAKEGTFLHAYMKYVSMLETPLSYDFWCGVWLLSSLLGRRIRIERPGAPVWLNTYLVLCAEAGSTRKSTAISRSAKVFRAISPDTNRLLTSKVTPEGLLDELTHLTLHDKPSTVNIAVSELVVFFGKERYTIGLPGLMTDLYDCPDIYEGVSSVNGRRVIKDVYVTFIAASTPSWLATAINPSVIEGGFTSRCLFIIEEKRKRAVAWPEQHDEQTLINDCVTLLQQILTDVEKYGSNGITISDAAKKWFIRWYSNRKLNVHDPFVASFEAREDHHILRLAGLLACNDRSYVIDAYHIKNAAKIINAHKQSATELFGTQKYERRMLLGIENLKAQLTNAGTQGLTQAEISYKMRNQLKGVEIDFILTIMQELQMVQQFEIPTKGRKSTLWRGTNRLLLHDLLSTVKQRLVQ